MKQLTWKTRVKAATVSLPNRGGQGVLVPGGLVITAAHCVGYYTTGGMALEDHVEPVETKGAARFRLAVYAVEPVADIAVLGMRDNQVLCEDAEAFEAFCERTPGIPVCAEDIGSHPLTVHVLTHRGRWTRGSVTEPGMSVGARAWLKAARKIEGGTSGGPVVNEDGHLMGVISFAGEEDFSGAIPRPHRALPQWLWSQVEAAQRDLLQPRTLQEHDSVDDAPDDDVPVDAVEAARAWFARKQSAQPRG